MNPFEPFPPPDFDGETYDRERDQDRLKAQLTRVRELMLDGKRRTLAEISGATGYPEASVSARLRDLRKAKFGAFIVERSYVERGIWEYLVSRRQIEYKQTSWLDGH